MQLNDFQFHLPPELIAQRPLPERSASRLLQLDNGTVSHHQMQQLAELLQPGDRLIFNDTRVIAARLRGQKQSGGKVEALIERLIDHDRMLVKLKASKSPRPGTIMEFGGRQATLLARHDDLFELRMALAGNESLDEFVESAGEIPLPPYIHRSADTLDQSRYQTIFARESGAVAAPTAGLHFDDELFAQLSARGIEHSFITLHVGAGTFQPVRVQNLQEHVMHPERVSVSESTVADIRRTKAAGGRVIAVGTTCVRSLEAASVATGTLQSFEGETRLFLQPGSKFHTVDAMITNFHLPESTLLMLVSAFGGFKETLAAYKEAVAQSYRFFSYGDAMLVWPASTQSRPAISTPS